MPPITLKTEKVSVLFNPLNREGWLTQLAKKLEVECFSRFGLKPYRVTCGWPCKGGTGLGKFIAGECFGIESSKAGLCRDSG